MLKIFDHKKKKICKIPLETAWQCPPPAKQNYMKVFHPKDMSVAVSPNSRIMSIFSLSWDAPVLFPVTPGRFQVCGAWCIDTTWIWL